MAFKNNLLAGQLTEHIILRNVRRISKREKFTEKLAYEQQARWLQCNSDESRPGEVRLYQMMVDGPARVVSLFRDKKRIEPVPSAEQFNLPKGSTRLVSATRTYRESPGQTPLDDPAERAILAALLDFAHWPAEAINVGHHWERQVSASGFEGTQKFEFADLGKIGDAATGRITLLVEGKFAGILEKDFTFGKAQAVIDWSRPDRMLLHVDAQAEYQRRRGGDVEDYRVKIEVQLAKTRALNEGEQESVKEQLGVFAAALKAQDDKLPKDAMEFCGQFVAKWPNSMWMPAVKELQRRLSPHSSDSVRLNNSQLKEALGKTIIAWEAGRANHNYDLMEKAKKTMAGLADQYRTKLKKLAGDSDANVRARVAFAMALGPKDEDLDGAQRLAKDESAAVRALALAGIAARASASTNIKLLVELTDDKELGVRRRACQAIAACMQREDAAVAKTVEKLDHLMVFDEAEGVRLEAIRAIAAIGAPADVPRLEKALHHELNQTNRQEIQRAIKVLSERI